ncbi:MAG: hypothetical protein GY696_14505 [Gammaproteobacteria bacterium]|nr:hypothetical protein [Gammaproteobacteria bacterium]
MATKLCPIEIQCVEPKDEIQFDGAHEAPSNGVLLFDGRRQARRENIELAASKQQIDTSSVVRRL